MEAAARLRGPTSMQAILHNISRDEDGLRVTVSLGSQPPRVFRAAYDDSDLGLTFGTLEQELFLTLSNMAYRRFGNCAVYQAELMKLLGAYAKGEELPSMPLVLGTTSFCTLRPSWLRIVWNKVWIFLRCVGLYRPRDYIAPPGGRV